MSEDRELLELAAKAAGYEIVGIAHKHIAQGVGEDDLLVANDRGGDSVWNPLTDDGDALRLSFELKLNIGYIGIPESHTVWAGNGIVSAEERLTGPESLRRAIVRAAAEIGRALP